MSWKTYIFDLILFVIVLRILYHYYQKHFLYVREKLGFKNENIKFICWNQWK